MEQLIGRTQERSELMRCYDSARSEFVILYGRLTDVYPWRSSKDVRPATQIDLVIERSDRYIYLCEMKFAEAEYVITKEYADKLRARMEVFREETKTRKALLTTFVTTYGVKTNLHSAIVQREVLMDDLYAPLMTIGR